MKPPWQVVTLGDVLHHRKDFITIDDTATYRRPRVQLHAKGIVLRDEISGSLITTKAQQVCRSGEFLVAEIDAKVGGCGIVPEALDNCIVSSHYFLFVVDEAKLDRRYLGYFIRTPTFREQVEAQGSTNYAAIRPSHVLAYTIPLPSLGEQQRIVAKVEELEGLIGEAKVLKSQCTTELAAVTRSRLNQVSRDITPTGSLGDILKTPPRNGWSARCDNAPAGLAVLSLAAVTGFRYRSLEFKRTSLYANPDGHFWLQPGDLLITRSNTPELVGHAAIYDGQPFPCIYPDLMMRLDLDLDAANPRFVWYWLQTLLVREFIRSKAKGTSPTMKKISQETVSAIPFPTGLPLARQQKIVEDLDSMGELLDMARTMQAETEAELAVLLPGVLDRAFRGELL